MDGLEVYSIDQLKPKSTEGTWRYRSGQGCKLVDDFAVSDGSVEAALRFKVMKLDPGGHYQRSGGRWRGPARP